MIEFLARWVLVGGLTVGLLLFTGGEVVWACCLAGVWIGFLNAFVRPLVLRLGGVRVWWTLGGLLSLLNFGMFLTLRAWVPWVSSGGEGGVGHVLFVACIVTAVSWVVASFFRAHDGRWHWITYHGNPLR